MIEVIIGVFVGYVLGVLPTVFDLVTKRDKKISPKARQPTEDEQRKYDKMMKEYVNFMTYDGSAQE